MNTPPSGGVEKRPIGARQKYAALRWYGEPQNTPRQARRISDWGEAHAKTPPPPLKTKTPPETGGHALATDTTSTAARPMPQKYDPPLKKRPHRRPYKGGKMKR